MAFQFAIIVVVLQLLKNDIVNISDDGCYVTAWIYKIIGRCLDLPETNLNVTFNECLRSVSVNIETLLTTGTLGACLP